MAEDKCSSLLLCMIPFPSFSGYQVALSAFWVVFVVLAPLYSSLLFLYLKSHSGGFPAVFYAKKRINVVPPWEPLISNSKIR
jgi:hypothetical protein